MACAGVVASAGAQLDFTVMTVASRTSGKATFFGFNSATSTGSLSNATLETQSGTVRTCTACEDQGTNLVFTLASCEDSDAAGFKSLVVGTLKLARSDRSAYSSGAFTFGISTSTVISSANGSTIIVQIRAD
jgi:hypothetical protein